MSSQAKKKVLILIDIQNDFLPGGALAVPNGDEVIAIANQWMDKSDFFDQVIATQDWHPKNHKSFASNHSGKSVGEIIDLNGINQVLWPDHCVQNTEGAKISHKLNLGKIQRIFQKGANPEVDSYSGFFDNDHKSSTGLGEYLKEIGITDVYLMGLATDYCVKFSALDCAGLGFKTHLIESGCRGIDLNPGDVLRSLEMMEAAGVEIVK
jgi:nicotinamidase/pyrazinamidase